MKPLERLRGMLAFDRLSARDRRALRLGLFVALPVVVWTFGVRPYRAALIDIRAQVESERALLAREEALVASADALPEARQAAEANVERVDRRLVDAPNIALVEATVIDHLETIAQKSRVLLREMRGLPPDRRTAESAVVQPIRLAVQGESDLDGVARLLLAIEESPLLLRIEELSIEPVMTRPESGGRGRSNDPPAEARPTGVVQMSLIVVAFAPPDVRGDTTSTNTEMSP